MTMSMTQQQLKNILEASILAAGKPLSIDRMLALFIDEHQPSRDDVRNALKSLEEDYAGRGIELREVGSGFRIQVRSEAAPWVARLWEERPQRYSRALLETIALIAYRQPITRAEIEEVRGVAVSSNIIKTLQEREWVRVVGHRDVPGKPALYATTREFLDYFNLKGLDELPSLMELRDLDSINAELEFELAANSATFPPEEHEEVPEAEETQAGEAAEDVMQAVPDQEAEEAPVALEAAGQR